MDTIFNYLLDKFKNFYGVAIGLAGVIFYFFNRKTARLEEDNNTLNTTIRELNSESRKIVTIQKKQTIIASEPDDTPDDIDKWMHDRANSSTKES